MSIARHLRGLMNRSVPYLMTCQQVDALMVDYIDGALRAGPHRRIKLHFRMCPDCKAFSESYKATIRATRATAGGDTAPPGDLVATVIGRISRRP